MADPVDTDALRMLAEDNAAASVVTNGITLVQRRSLSGESMRALRAAADEVDRLRDDHAEWKSYAAKEKRAWQVENVNRKEAEEESFRLRAVIENAPHADGCSHVTWDADGLLRVGVCTCWKADAL